MPLTDRAIRNSKPADKPMRLFDGGGMYLEISPAGGRWWRLKYRFAGKEKRLSLGVYPDVSLAEARGRREAARKLLAKAIDPSEQRKADKQEAATRATNSFESIAREWHGKQLHTWTARHASGVLHRLEANLFPEVGARPLSEVTAPVLLAALRKIEHRGAYHLAHRVLQTAGQVFRYGVASGRCDRDPSGDLRGALTPHVEKHQSAVTPEELPELLRAVARYGEFGDKLTEYALRLMTLTFVRTNELIGAEWDEFDLDGAMWTVPAERMKKINGERVKHFVPLSRQAVAVLRQLRDLGGGSRYVFPGRNPDKPLSNNTMLFALYRLGYKGRMTGHGFRGVASTMLNESGFNADWIERQLAHGEKNEVRGAYNSAKYLADRRLMMQQWADMVDALVQGAQVIPLHRAAVGS